MEPSHLTLNPGGTSSVLVRYLPKALGRHSADIPFAVLTANGTVVATAKCEVHGSSLQVGKRQALAGGTEAMPETFIKDRWGDAAGALLVACVLGMRVMGVSMPLSVQVGCDVDEGAWQQRASLGVRHGTSDSGQQSQHHTRASSV